MDLKGMLFGRADQSRAALDTDGMTPYQRRDALREHLTNLEACQAYQADHSWLLSDISPSAGSATYANVGGQIVDISSAEYAAWYDRYYGQAPLD
jgi:hypothetical protein